MYRGRDFGKDNPGVQVDFPKMLKGPVAGSFFALYIPARMSNDEAARYALAQLEILKRQVAANPDKVAFATSEEDFRRNVDRGLVSVFMGLENGSALLSASDMLDRLYSEGVRYVTLCHSADNGICDSCTGEGKWGGLSPEGRQMVERMNSIGMMVDVAHTSNAVVKDVLSISTKPIAYTHGCCSALCSHKRNLPDELLKSIADKGGVSCMSIYPCFLSEDCVDFDEDHPDGRPMPGLEFMINHIRHAVNVAGIDHVGIGTDYDGIEVTAKGVESIDRFGIVLKMMEKAGFSDDEIEKIASENLLRVISSQV